MNRLGATAAERLLVEHVVEACDALLVRLRRIAQAATQSPDEYRLEQARQAHVRAGEALLNLLSALREADPEAQDAQRIEGELARLLDGARGWFPGEIARPQK